MSTIGIKGERDTAGTVYVIPINNQEIVEITPEASAEMREILIDEACADCPAFGESCKGPERVLSDGMVLESHTNQVITADECRIPGRTFEVPAEGIEFDEE